MEKYEVELPKGYWGQVQLQRLMANGSDAITGVTFDGFTYNWEVDQGRPVKLSNVTSGERQWIRRDGKLVVDVPRSSAVIVRFDEQCGWA